MRNFGLKVGVVGHAEFETRIPEMLGGLPRIAAFVEPMLTIRRVMRQEFTRLHKMLLDFVRHDPVCQRPMTAPEVGAVVALTYRATVDQPQRFVHSRAVGAHIGQTPRRHQSGDIDYDGGISKCGDTMLRTMLYEAPQTLLKQSGKWSWLKAWACGSRSTGASAVSLSPQQPPDYPARRASAVLPRQERGPHEDEGGVRS